MHPLATPTTLVELESDGHGGSLIPPTPAPLPPDEQLSGALDAEAYIYSAPVEDLEAELWSYEEFVRTNAWKWISGISV